MNTLRDFGGQSYNYSNDYPPCIITSRNYILWYLIKQQHPPCVAPYSSQPPSPRHDLHPGALLVVQPQCEASGACLAEANAYVADGDTTNVISSISTEGLRLMSVLCALLPPGNALEFHFVVVRRVIHLQIVSRHC